MASLQIGNEVGVAGRSGANINGGSSDIIGLSLTNAQAQTVAQLRTRLAAIDAGLYTDAMLNTMSYNDMIYAVRLNDQPSTI